MTFFKSKAVLLLAAFAFSAQATANDNIWFGVKAGTLGIGGEVMWRPIEWFDIRGGANFYDYDDSGDYGGLNYDGTLALDTYYLTGNLHFPLSPLRFTVGAYQNQNELQLTSEDAASYLLGSNPVPYTPADIGTLTATATFDDFAPYVGAGFDFDILDRLGISLDFGVLWQGEPTVTMTADGLLGSDPTLLADLNEEIAELQGEVEDYKAYPVVSLGFNFNFF